MEKQLSFRPLLPSGRSVNSNSPAGRQPARWIESETPPIDEASLSPVLAANASSNAFKMLQNATLPTGEPASWQSAARYCVRHRLSNHLEWLSRRSVEVGMGPGTVQDAAQLDLRGIHLSANHLAFVVRWISERKDKVPIKVDLSGNAMGEKRIRHVCTLLQDPCVVALNVSNCGLTKTHVGSLCSTLGSNSTLIELKLNGNDCPGAGGVIGEMLSVNSSLTTLEVADCSLGPDSIAQLAKGLEQNRSLEHLDLSRNRRVHVDEGIISLTLSLFFQQSLRSLDLSGLNLKSGDKCMYAIAAMMERNTSIESLRLAMWNVTQKGMETLGDCLGTTKTLQRLDLAFPINLKSQTGLHEGLSRNSSLTALTLAHWDLTDGLANALEQMLSREGCRLRKLDITEPDFAERPMYEPLARAMEKNRTLVDFTSGVDEKDRGEELNDICRHVQENVRFLRELPNRTRAALTLIFQARGEFMPNDLVGELAHSFSIPTQEAFTRL